ncbi:MAG TPA: hypothetical protein VIM11_11040, partial [Tepidisphaeraceae bacterium]
MGFASGSVSFRRFAVVGKGPQAVDEKMLERLSKNALRPTEMGAPEEVEYGWSGGRHVLDGDFSFDHNVFADAVHFALRVDTNKVPGELKKAWQAMEEDAAAAGNPSGFISKSQKREVKDSIQGKIDEELRSGKFRRSRLLPILWDVPSSILYSPASNANFEKLAEIFERTFGLELNPLSAGQLALRKLEAIGRRREYEDARPTRFVPGPTGEGEYPDYPWVAKGPEPKDFLGNEFLLWLWHEADHRNGTIKTEDAGEVTIYIDKALDVDCAYGQTGKDFIRGDAPSRMAEARDALRSGKVPRKAGFVIDAFRQQFMFNLNAETMALSTVKLPEVEDAETPRVLFEERIAL